LQVCWLWQFSVHCSLESSSQALAQRLDTTGLPPAVRASIEAQRSKLAAAETPNARGREAIDDAFVAGYRAVLLVAVGLSLAQRPLVRRC